MDLRLESEGEDGGKKTQSWTLVSEKGAKDVNKGAVTLFFEQLTSKLIKRLAEGVARSLIFQGSYGAESEAKKRWGSIRALTAKGNAAVAPHPDSAGPPALGRSKNVAALSFAQLWRRRRRRASRLRRRRRRRTLVRR